MKKFGVILLFTTIIFQGFSQESSAESNTVKHQMNVSDTNEITRVIIGKDIISVEDNADEVNIKVGNKGLRILESLEGKGPKFEFKNYVSKDEREKIKSEKESVRPASRFKGHWSAIEFGFNNYNHITNTILPDDIAYMRLNSGKSHSFNINFSQLSLGITRRFGIVSGLGLNWNNYVFANNNNIEIGDRGYIVELIPAGGEILKKSKFTTLYMNIPAMLELQFQTGEGHHLNIAAGAIGGVKLGSHTKMVFENGQKVKSNSDLNMNILRGGVTGRIGYGNFMVYGTYYLTQWFHDNQGPNWYELEPFEIGFALTFND
jgi:hypothetical protein